MSSHDGNRDKPRSFHVTVNTSDEERRVIQLSMSGVADANWVISDVALDGSSLQMHLIYKNDVIDEKLAAPPTHEEGIARIIEASYAIFGGQSEALQDHLDNTYPCLNGTSCVTTDKAFSAEDVDNVASQWILDSPPWLRAENYFQEEQLPCDLKYLKCLSIKENQLLVLHNASRYHSLSYWKSALYAGRASNFLASAFVERKASILLANGERDHFTRILVSEFLYACVLGWNVSSHSWGTPSLFADDTEDDLRQGQPPKSQVIEQYHCVFLELERFEERAQSLLDVTEFVLQILEVSAKDAPARSHEQQIQEYAILVRSKCKALVRAIADIKKRKDKRYDLFVRSLSIDDSISIKRLTTLAAVFLPLSLASSILSMQTRFIDLGLLLYDFIGVFLLIASFAVLVYYIVRASITVAKRDRSRLKKEYAPWNLRWWSSKANNSMETSDELYVNTAMMFCAWAILVVSFTVGMVLKVTLGLKILGYGFAALLGLWLLSAACFCCACFLVCYCLCPPLKREEEGQ